jgi:hypothetical protein
MAADAIAVAASRVVAPASSAAPGLVEEQQATVGIAADRQPVTAPDELDERQEEVADEHVPSASVGDEPGFSPQHEARSIADRENRARPAGVRIQQAANHLTDRLERMEGDVVGLAVGKLDVVIGQVPDTVGRDGQVIVIAVIDHDAGEPVAAGSVPGVGNPEEIGERASRQQGERFGVARADPAHVSWRPGPSERLTAPG